MCVIHYTRIYKNKNCPSLRRGQLYVFCPPHQLNSFGTTVFQSLGYEHQNWLLKSHQFDFYSHHSSMHISIHPIHFDMASFPKDLKAIELIPVYLQELRIILSRRQNMRSDNLGSIYTHKVVGEKTANRFYRIDIHTVVAYRYSSVTTHRYSQFIT